MSELSVRKRVRQYKWHQARVQYHVVLDASKWCDKTMTKGQWTFSISTGKFAFKNEGDALMFKLAWENQ